MDTFHTTHLDDIGLYGGMEPMGAGSYGGTYWQCITAGVIVWRSTFLHDIANYGGMEPMGAGSYGGTLWVKTL